MRDPLNQELDDLRKENAAVLAANFSLGVVLKRLEVAIIDIAMLRPAEGERAIDIALKALNWSHTPDTEK